jgi:hypothetical protein
MPDGSLHALTPHEAEILRGFLHDRLCHGEEQDQLAVMRMIRHVDLVMSPEAQFDDIYRPRDYVPAWSVS